MDKIEFKNLPDTTTPLNAENLNTMQNNIEAEINSLPVAKYRTSGTAFDDPNTTTYDLILTSLNTPESGVYYYIKTFFYQNKSATSNRSQIAIGYNNNKVWQRYYYDGTWSDWRVLNQVITTGTEYETGRIIDGKKEYGKKINIGALPNATAKYIATGLSNVKVVDYSGMAFSSNAGRKIPFASEGNYVDIYPNSSGATFTINTNYDYSSYSEAYLDVHYTKNS